MGRGRLASKTSRLGDSVGVGAEADGQNMSLRVLTPTADDLAEAAAVLAAEKVATADAAAAAAAADTVAA